MTDMQKLFDEGDTLSPEEIKALYDYIRKNHIEFVPAKMERINVFGDLELRS